MPEDTCAPRIASLSEQAKALESRASELAAQRRRRAARARQRPPTSTRYAATLRAALKDSTPTRIKAVLQTMIDEIRVDARDHIEPTFRVPAVRIDYGYMDETARRANRVLMAAAALDLA